LAKNGIAGIFKKNMRIKKKRLAATFTKIRVDGMGMRSREKKSWRQFD